MPTEPAHGGGDTMYAVGQLRQGGFCLAILLASLCGCAPRATTMASGTWHELRTERFRAWTDGDPEAVRVLLEDLERFDYVLRALTSGEERSAAPPLRIFVAKDQRSFRALLGARSNLGGLFAATLRGNYAIVGGTAEAEADDPYALASRAVLFHEYTHYVMSTSGARVPSWYNEGFAEYMSTTAFRDDGRYTIGCVPQHRAAWTRYIEWLPMQKVLAADNVADLEGSRGTQRTGTHVGSNRNPADSYAQSWYAVHYFLADGQRKAQLTRYLQLWSAGTAPADAAPQAFGVSVDELDRMLQAYSRQHEFECVAVKPPQPIAVPNVEVIPLGTGAAHGRVGDLLLAIMGPTQSTLDVLEQAGQLDPGDPRVSLTMMRARLMEAERSDDPARTRTLLAEAERHFTPAVRRGSDAAEVWALAGHLARIEAALARRVEQPHAAKLKVARTFYRNAIRRDETLAEAYVGLGATYLIEDNGSKEAQVALEAAGYLLPLDTEIPLMLAKIYIGRGSVPEAIVALEYVVRWSSNDQRREVAKTALAELRASPVTPASAKTP